MPQPQQALMAPPSRQQWEVTQQWEAQQAQPPLWATERLHLAQVLALGRGLEQMAAWELRQTQREPALGQALEQAT